MKNIVGDIGSPHTLISPLSHVLNLKTWEVEEVWSGGGEHKVKGRAKKKREKEGKKRIGRKEKKEERKEKKRKS